MGGEERTVRKDAHLGGRLALGLVLSLAVHALLFAPVHRWVTTEVPPGEPAPPPPPGKGPAAIDPCAAVTLTLGQRPDEVFGPLPDRHRLHFVAPHAQPDAPGPWPTVVLLRHDTPDLEPAPDADLAPRLGTDGQPEPAGVPAPGAAPPAAPLADPGALPALATALARQGFAVAVIDLRPAAGPRLHADEVRLAVRWLHTQRARLHLKPSAMAVVGGQTAARVALGDRAWLPTRLGLAHLDRLGALRAAVLASVPTDAATLPQDAWASGCAEAATCPGCGAETVGVGAGLGAGLGAAGPELLIVAGNDDCAVPAAQARRLHDDLKAGGGAVRFRGTSGVVRPEHLLTDGRHRYALEGFLNETLRACVPAELVAPILSEEEVDRLIALAAEAPPTPPEPVRPEPVNEKQDRQVVEIPPPENPEKPENARFQSEYNSKVEKEMVSALNEAPTPRVMKSDLVRLGHGEVVEGDAKEKPDRTERRPDQSKQRPAPEPGDAEQPGDKPAPPSPTPREKVTAKASKSPSERPEVIPPGEGPFRADQPQADTPEVAAGGGKVGGAPAPASYRDLLPSLGKVEQLRKDGSIDYIENIDRGEKTALNTDEYKHAWFFNRVKAQVQQRWRAVEAHRRYDPYGRVYGVRDRLTVVQVTLNADGSLDDLHLAKDSGVGFLDDSALQAFREAQPFPHPPDALRDPDGRIRFRFSFFLEINGGGMRMFRAP